VGVSFCDFSDAIKTNPLCLKLGFFSASHQL
jgi:hypothetical protein